MERDLLGLGLNLPDEMPLKRSNFKHLSILLKNLPNNILRTDLPDHKKTDHKGPLPVIPPALSRLVMSHLKS